MLTKLDRQFISRFNLAGKKFADTMRKLLATAALPTEEGRAAKAAIKRAARAAELEMKAATKAWVSKAIRDAIESGSNKAYAWSLKPSNAEFITGSTGISFAGVNEKLANRLIADAAGKLVKISESTGGVAARHLRTATLARENNNAISLELAKGVVNQETMTQLRQRVLNATGLEKGDPVVLSNGRIWDAEYYAETTARTRTMEAANDSFAAQMKNYGQDYYFIPEHDGVDPKDICYAVQGKVWAFYSNNELGFPTLQSIGRDFPPLHPNCAHTVSPWVPGLKDDSEIDSELSAHDSDSDMLADVKN